jgi:hypothetical protein
MVLTTCRVCVISIGTDLNRYCLLVVLSDITKTLNVLNPLLTIASPIGHLLI